MEESALYSRISAIANNVYVVWQTRLLDVTRYFSERVTIEAINSAD